MADKQSEADHVEMTVQRMAELHTRQRDGQSLLQRRVSSLTYALSRPRVAAPSRRTCAPLRHSPVVSLGLRD